MAVNYQNNNLHAMITFCEIERIKRPGQGVQARIDSAAELLSIIRADLKNKYDSKSEKCRDLNVIRGLDDMIAMCQAKVDIEYTTNGLPYMDNETQNDIITDIRDVVDELLTISAREDLFDRSSIPAGEAPEIEGVRRKRTGMVTAQ
jgi:hypothetical protein